MEYTLPLNCRGACGSAGSSLLVSPLTPTFIHSLAFVLRSTDPRRAAYRIHNHKIVHTPRHACWRRAGMGYDGTPNNSSAELRL